MKKLKYSLVALLALGALNHLVAETQTNGESAEKTDKTIPPSTKTSLLEALKGTTIGGYAYGQVTSMFGSDASGTALRVRTLMDINTGAFHGFSVGTRLFASMGGGAPDGGTFLDNSGFKINDTLYNSPAAVIPVGMLALYGRQTFESSATVITAGKINIAAPFADQGWDFGYGVSVDNYDLAGIGFHLQAYGAWGLDNSNNIYNPATSATNPNFSSEKALFVFGVSGDRKVFSGVGFDLWAAHALDTIDFLTFADINYTISGFKIQTQLAATQVNTGSKHFNAPNVTLNGQNNAAKLRGLYNFQFSYDGSSGVSATVGYTGSFGDGYGAMLNYISSFNMGGKIWYDTLGSGANGYGIGGSGGQKHLDGRKTDIQVAYFSLGYKGVSKLSMSLDYAYVGGNNNYKLMVKGNANHPGTKNGHMDATMHEVSFSANYAFTEKLSLSALVGSTFGDLQMGRARVKLNYSF